MPLNQKQRKYIQDYLHNIHFNAENYMEENVIEMGNQLIELINNSSYDNDEILIEFADNFKFQ